MKRAFFFIDHNGLVTENVYNDKGEVEKIMQYHKDLPAYKLYTEKVVNDKGQETATLNEFGNEVSKYTYDKNGELKSEQSNDGIITGFGYDNNTDKLIQVSTNIDGETNSNVFGYTGDFLTTLSHNDTSINFEYNGFGQKTRVDVAGIMYCATEYKDILEPKVQDNNEIINVLVGQKSTTTNANGEKFIVYTNLDGNVTKVEFVDKDSNSTTLLENRYDGYGNLVYSKDNQVQSEINYSYDQFGREIEKAFDQNGERVSIKNVFDDSNNISSSAIKIGELEQTCENVYDYSTPEPKLVSSKVGDFTETYVYDKLDRVSSVQFGDMYSKHYNYLQKGSCTSALVASEWFGKNGAIKENLKYKYDINGNITKVLENGVEVVRYSYDGLSRLTREDNRVFNKTTTFTYDAGGNILERREYPYTTQSELFEPTQKFNYTYPIRGWRDQLLSYNGEECQYDALGNPTEYRNVPLEWGFGRQLLKYGDDISFSYNASGVRTSKVVDGKKTDYYLDGTRVLMQDNGNKLFFHYGLNGVSGFTYVGVGELYYKKNMLGDIIAIIDNNGQEIAKYAYDAWGNSKTFVLDNGQFVDTATQLSYTESGLNNKAIAELNPFRYSRAASVCKVSYKCQKRPLMLYVS